MSVSDSQGICPASAVLSVISELAERGDRPDPSLLDPQSPHPMSQHPGGHTHDERSSGWKSEEYLIPETQTEPDAESSRYHEMHVQEQPQTLGDLRSTRQTSYRTSDAPAADLAHYSDRTSYLGPVATVYLQPDSAGPAHLERAERSTQPSDFPYRSHQHPPYPPAYGEEHHNHTDWTSRQYERRGLEHGYLAAHPYHFSQESRGHDYTATSPSAGDTRYYSPLSPGVDQGRQDRLATLQPLQSGSYVSNVPPSPSEGSSFVDSPADHGSSPHTYLSHAGLDQHGGRAFMPTAEPVSHIVETPQLIVPSSRISRGELSPYPATSSQAPVSPTSNSPHVPTETKPKRRRANAIQLSLLNETYARTMFPTTEERAEIARRINMTPRQVQIWFQNRRQASRQQQSPAPQSSPGARSQTSQERDLSDEPIPDVKPEE